MDEGICYLGVYIMGDQSKYSPNGITPIGKSSVMHLSFSKNYYEPLQSWHFILLMLLTCTNLSPASHLAA